MTNLRQHTLDGSARWMAATAVFKPVRSVVLLGVLAGAGVLAAWLGGWLEPSLPKDAILARFDRHTEYAPLTIRYPLDGTLFPPEIVPPVFRWEDGSAESDAWVVAIDFQDAPDRLSAACVEAAWRPSEEQWEAIQRRSVQSPAKVTVLGVNRRRPRQILSAGTISMSTSRDPVGAPIFYREVGLPFSMAVRDTAAHIRWRFGEVSSRQQPPVVLQRLPVCANCHSFSADGSVLGMDVDYANDKGSYVVEKVAAEVLLRPEKIITWSDYRREDGETTFGLLSQVSPDGRYVASTVKDQSVFVARRDLAFSQLFFPIQGILAIYDCQRKQFHALPGADDPSLVQSNPSWSPDGKYLVFARSKVYQPKRPLRRKAILLRAEDCAEFLDGRQSFRFDLYRIPFNEGKGGKAEPLRGASHNGMSNFFARYSPDGKWIVFCKAKSFMLLQPDSELYILPAEGGEARRLECNTPRMNSWHSWSPNGKWLVFSSKWNSPYTQLFLTHVDADGHSTPPVLLERFTAPDRAANIPEFVNAPAGAIRSIREQFIDDAYYARSGDILRFQGDHRTALRDFRKALDLNPRNVQALVGMGASLAQLGETEEARRHLARAIALDPDQRDAHDELGNLLARQHQFAEAAECFRQALRIDPSFAVAHFRLGVVLLDLGRLEEAEHHLAEAARLEPRDAKALCSLGAVLLQQGKPRQAAAQYRRALEIDPRLLVALSDLAGILATSTDPALRDGKEALELATRACQLTRYRDPAALLVLSEAYAEVGRFGDATDAAEQVLQMGRAAGDQNLIQSAQARLERYQQQMAYRRSREP